MAAFPYSCQTGPYTIDQLDGADCAICNKPFGINDKTRPYRRVAEWHLFAHLRCVIGGASK